jgi:hypothetical protein
VAVIPPEWVGVIIPESLAAMVRNTQQATTYLRNEIMDLGFLSSYNAVINNAKEQAVLGEFLLLRKEGKGSKSIAAELNRRDIPSKTGGRWWSSSVQNILNRIKCSN